jgi:hypothetical protein
MVFESVDAPGAASVAQRIGLRHAWPSLLRWGG